VTAHDYRALSSFIAERGIALGKPIEIFDEIDSTNDALKRAAKVGATHGTLYVAEVQSRGRGRQGRSWLGERGESILASVLVRIDCEPQRLPPLSIVSGLAVRDALGVARAKLKWPNDVLIDDSKVAGVLVEAVLLGSRVEAVIIGFGINVHQRAFSPEIAARATSVALRSSTPPDRALILADVLAGLDRDLAHVAARGLGLLHARIRAADALAGRRVRLEDGTEAEALGVDLEGTLRVRKDDGAIVRLSAGEVHLTIV
jgi:BirA family biotin operon repressor/biotin-[acetyl-CoA-carboxylase] ligase